MQLKASRRRFLSVLGASPLAVKAAADEATAKLLHIDTSGLGSRPGLPYDYGRTAANVPTNADNPYAAAARFIRQFGIPEWFDKELRDRAAQVYTLDPDIACKRSWSLAVKIATQRERNYRRLLAEIDKAERIATGRAAVTKVIGYWPW